jgi:hypothetical protein
MTVCARINDKLGLAQRNDAQGVVARFKSVTKFLSEAVDAAKDNDAIQGVIKAVPWESVTIVGKSVVQALPPLKFVYSLIEKLTEIIDPDELGCLACTVAYQRSVEQAFRAVAPTSQGRIDAGKLKKRLEHEPDDLADFAGFSYETALTHWFVVQADAALQAFAEGFNYDGDQARKILDEVHNRFVPNLKDVLATTERFKNFKERVALGSSETRAQRALQLHAAYQVWQFEERPVFSGEPFSLQEIYVEIECGELRWEVVRKSRNRESGPSSQTPISGLDPFVETEQSGGRKPLLHGVLDLMADPTFQDAIVIQGLAGSGKSSFTLRLCARLRELGLRPIRVRLSDLALDETRPIRDALSLAVQFYDPASEESPGWDLPGHGEDIFQGGTIFNDPIPFSHGVKKATISRYVLILDAWDELSVGVSGNLHDRVERVLTQIRNEFLTSRAPRIRVILTGRPSSAVEDSRFLKDDTELLTIRPLSPVYLRDLVARLGRVLARPVALDGESPRPSRGSLDLAEFEPLFQTYEQNHEELRHSDRAASDSSPLGVLGLPLLAQVVVRLVVEAHVEPLVLVSDPTTLFRRLVDMTCEESGQVSDHGSHPGDTPRFQGHELRRLLRHTASAITVRGLEAISSDELYFRLQVLDRDGAIAETARQGRIDEATSRNRLTHLLISYYFKASHPEAGCEFAHKSFREYLFAEAIVEELKDYARRTPPPSSGRREFWMDFDESDPRRFSNPDSLSRRLGTLLAPGWLSPEVENHVGNLIAWEIHRETAAGNVDLERLRSLPTAPIGLDDWSRIRDDLADLWEWWGEGVHLRPQIKRSGMQIQGFDSKLAAIDLIEWALPKDLPRRAVLPPSPQRTTTVDAHLGAGLFLLCVVTHGVLARRQAGQEPDSSEHPQVPGQEATIDYPKPYQSRRKRGWGDEVRFYPSSREQYLSNYLARINAAGWRPKGRFPARAHLSGAHLSGAHLSGADLSRADLSGADLRGAYLSLAHLSGADLRGAELSGAHLSEADLRGADLRGADLIEADLRGADLRRTGLRQRQIDSAHGDETTKLPDDLERPTQWTDSR